MTTIHAYTNDQRLADVPHKDLRRARAAAEEHHPDDDGRRARGRESAPPPQGEARRDGPARPGPGGSVVDLAVKLKKAPSAAEINSAVRSAAAGPMARIVEYSEAPLVSTDIIGNPHSSIFDALSTKALERRVREGGLLVRQRVGLLAPRGGPDGPPRRARLKAAVPSELALEAPASSARSGGPPLRRCTRRPPRLARCVRPGAGSLGRFVPPPLGTVRPYRGTSSRTTGRRSPSGARTPARGIRRPSPASP